MKKLTISQDVEVDENDSQNWEAKNVAKSNIHVLVQQYQEEVQEVAKEASMLMPPIQQYDSSLEFTPS